MIQRIIGWALIAIGAGFLAWVFVEVLGEG
jgi:hypothetical protein